MRSDVQEAAKLLRESNRILISGHINPDGDSLGSMCALGHVLRSLGKTVVSVSPDGVPDGYKFLPGSDRIVTQLPHDRQFDLCVMVDSENEGRLGDVAQVLKSCKKTLDIDHHPGGERTADVQVIDATSASSGEIVYEILMEMGVRIGPAVAECLLTAIVTDTGCFRFSNVKPTTLRTAASLIEKGASISKVVRRVYETRPLSSAKLLGAALSSLNTSENGRIAYASITQEQMAAAGADASEAEGIVNYVRSVRGARIGILFREEEGGTTRVSLRAGEGFDVAQVARLFGGGGHKTAAGCTIDRPVAEAVDLVIGAAQKWMAS